ncbi:MAG: hypothetical protein ACP5OO_09740 [Chloroflexia bacterium]
MVQYEAMDWFPHQILTLQELQSIIQQARASLAGPWPNRRSEREWNRLAGLVQEALEEVFLWGSRAKDEHLRRVHDYFESLKGGKKKASAGTLQAVRAAYVTFLDRIYGAIFRHVLLHLPTALCTEVGHFHLSQVVIFRYARLRDAEKSGLEELLEFFYLGGPRFEMIFSWTPLGAREEKEPPIWLR